MRLVDAKPVDGDGAVSSSVNTGGSWGVATRTHKPTMATAPPTAVATREVRGAWPRQRTN